MHVWVSAWTRGRTGKFGPRNLAASLHNQRSQTTAEMSAAIPFPEIRARAVERLGIATWRFGTSPTPTARADDRRSSRRRRGHRSSSGPRAARDRSRAATPLAMGVLGSLIETDDVVRAARQRVPPVTGSEEQQTSCPARWPCLQARCRRGRRIQFSQVLVERQAATPAGFRGRSTARTTLRFVCPVVWPQA